MQKHLALVSTIKTHQHRFSEQLKGLTVPVSLPFGSFSRPALIVSKLFLNHSISVASSSSETSGKADLNIELAETPSVSVLRMIWPLMPCHLFISLDSESCAGNADLGRRNLLTRNNEPLLLQLERLFLDRESLCARNFDQRIGEQKR